MQNRDDHRNSLISKISFIIFVELYSLLTSFFGTPLLAPHAPAWVWIAVLSIFLISGHFAACYLLRNDNPLLWLFGIPVNVIVICILANINDPFFIRSLGLYGIISKYMVEEDQLITFIPYYFDSLIYAILIAAGRIMFAAPTYYIAKSNKFGQEALKFEK